MPQNSWPIVAIRITALAAAGAERAVEDRQRGAEPKPLAASLMNSVLVAAKVIASSTSQPIAPAQKTERQTPLAAPSAAPLRLLADVGRGVVAGLRVHRQQEPERQDVEPEADAAGPPLNKPVLLIRSVKTKSTLWCLSGTMIRIPMITATPSTCQPTEMLLNSATSGEEKMLISEWMLRNRANRHERLEQDVLGVAEVHEPEVEPVEAEQRVGELRRGVDDRSDHADEADQVEPAGEPAPGLAAEVGRPVVDAARGRVLGDQLGHRERDQQDEPADDRPAPGDRDRTAVVPGERSRS